MHQALVEHDIPLSSRQRQQLATHFTLLTQWNAVHNLTRLSTPLEAVYGHYLDILLGLRHVRPGRELLDVGCGAGFPGLVAAVLWPRVLVRCLDSRRKKCVFVQTAAQAMELDNVRVEHGRAQTCLPARLVVSRATFAVERLTVLSRCLRQPGSSRLALWVTMRQQPAVCRQLEIMGLTSVATFAYRHPHGGDRAIVTGRSFHVERGVS